MHRRARKRRHEPILSGRPAETIRGRRRIVSRNPEGEMTRPATLLLVVLAAANAWSAPAPPPGAAGETASPPTAGAPTAVSPAARFDPEAATRAWLAKVPKADRAR